MDFRSRAAHASTHLRPVVYFQKHVVNDDEKSADGRYMNERLQTM